MIFTKIVLADDHNIVRQGLKSLLDAEADFQVVGEASNGIDTIRLVDQLKPDILVTDLMMPELNGIEVIRQALQMSPMTRIIVLSMHSNEAYVVQALKSGAKGYLLKDDSLGELVKGVRSVLLDKIFLSHSISEVTIEMYMQQERSTSFDDPYETLTNRERQIFQMVAEGMSSSEIGNRLVISSRTVETHRANLMKKLNANNQADIIRIAIRKGIISLED